MMSQAVQYMARTRAYYEAQGFEVPYTWAHFDEIPFTPLVRPLRESRIALITT
ncbi:MAG TPA: glycine reductase, partial [Pseudomonadales bacterium]|nr:glycine reductase [Pseudomonadales bacterium]